jgi:hypothetical protein
MSDSVNMASDKEGLLVKEDSVHTPVTGRKGIVEGGFEEALLGMRLIWLQMARTLSKHLKSKFA